MYERLWPRKNVLNFSSQRSISPDDLAKATRSVAQHDANADGVLSGEEWASSSTFEERMDLNGDGIITLAELAQSLARK